MGHQWTVRRRSTEGAVLGLGGWAEEATEACRRGTVGEEGLQYASRGEGTNQTGQRLDMGALRKLDLVAVKSMKSLGVD